VRGPPPKRAPARAGRIHKGLIGLALLMLLAGYAADLLSRRGAADRRTGGVVRYVYDGDTVRVNGAGKVRMIGIDALDGHNEKRMHEQARRYGMPVQRVRAWADRATEFAIEHLKGEHVQLLYGEEPLDSYGRVLAYVHVGNGEEERDFNLIMLERGLAAAYRRYPHPRRDAYLAAEERARREKTGLWAEAGIEP
jgi:micrococcal nuclease